MEEIIFWADWFHEKAEELGHSEKDGQYMRFHPLICCSGQPIRLDFQLNNNLLRLICSQCDRLLMTLPIEARASL